MVYKSCVRGSPDFIQYVNKELDYFNLNGACRISTRVGCSMFGSFYWWKKFKDRLNLERSHKKIFKVIVKESYNINNYW